MITNKWIGPELNMAGSYEGVEGCRGLMRRLDKRKEPLYYFASEDSRMAYWLTDRDKITELEKRVKTGEGEEILHYVHLLIAETFGIKDIVFLMNERENAAYEKGVRDGEERVRYGIRNLLEV
ncbi:hypothetical protein IMZ31_19645 (plasmid) [Pontibacillus sp. ALD_SL1]|uniref:hypothetical protein n=1 Tax=Pontibacillus sp. ALD_SL1 TaxID=2777185 RepID=UPI001A9692E0|nr:hypothetical protein [Pontibacillus sp. ALD_SL1]QST02766.1 hypothetical protein IMZ31_19645 [Pontibacillus sp. ALD_SL1]